jgi:hypothetical protein
VKKTCSKCGEDKEMTLEHFKKSHVKSGFTSRCKACEKEYHRKHYLENRDEILRKGREYDATHREEVRARKKRYREANKEKIKVMKHEYYLANKEEHYAKFRVYYLEHKEAFREYSKKWYDSNGLEYSRAYSRKNREAVRASNRRSKKKHRPRRNADSARAYASRKQRTPSYANPSAIERIYRVAHIMSSLGKTIYHVDHIDPLRGKLVSGLHHEDNLQILTAKENLDKGNRFTPYSVDCTA